MLSIRAESVRALVGRYKAALSTQLIYRLASRIDENIPGKTKFVPQSQKSVRIRDVGESPKSIYLAKNCKYTGLLASCTNLCY
jgi:hypothetical protein